MSRFPPVLAVFVESASQTLRPTLGRMLPQELRDRVVFTNHRRQPPIPNLVVEELRGHLQVLSTWLSPDVAPAVLVLLVLDAEDRGGVGTLPDLVRQAQSRELPATTLVLSVEQCDTTATHFRMSRVWRRGALNGGGLREEYVGFVYAFLATEASRYKLTETFSALRFGEPGRRFLVGIDRTPRSDSGTEARRRLQHSVAAHYLPEVSPEARAAAVAHAAHDLDEVERMVRSGRFDPEQLDAIASRAVANSRSLAEAVELMFDWAHRRSGGIGRALHDLAVGLNQWKSTATPSRMTDVGSLFGASGFPLLRSVGQDLAHPRLRDAWESLEGSVRGDVLESMRRRLDEDFYDFLPPGLAKDQELELVARAMGNPTGAAASHWTRHLSNELVRNLRDEIVLPASGSCVLYHIGLGAP
jgi:hypothetical protein